MKSFSFASAAIIIVITSLILQGCGEPDAYAFATGNGNTKVVVVNTNPIMGPETPSIVIPSSASLPSWQVQMDAPDSDLLAIITGDDSAASEDLSGRLRLAVEKSCQNHPTLLHFVAEALEFQRLNKRSPRLLLTKLSDNRETIHVRFTVIEQSSNAEITLHVEADVLRWMSHYGPALLPTEDHGVEEVESSLTVTLIDDNSAIVATERLDAAKNRLN
ncbi:MAG: hypothetical protein ACI97A_004330 [Planctomycetota bacterium]|jgi:hypothetical protein